MQLKFLSDREEKSAWGLGRLSAPRSCDWNQDHVYQAINDRKTWLWVGLIFLTSYVAVVIPAGLFHLMCIQGVNWRNQQPEPGYSQVPRSWLFSYTSQRAVWDHAGVCNHWKWHSGDKISHRRHHYLPLSSLCDGICDACYGQLFFTYLTFGWILSHRCHTWYRYV